MENTTGERRMLDHPLQDIDAWVLLFSNNSLPVLRVTKRRLDEMRQHIDDVDARELSRVVVQDPMMTARVFAFTQSIGSRSLQRDITTIASAVMMIGIEPFFKRFDDLPTIEGMLKGEDKHALLGVLQIIRRSQRAADYAQEWAIWRNDVNMEEVRIAALLHDLAELLVWTFAPSLGLEIHAQQLAHPNLRSVDAQRNTLGLSFEEIQEALCRVWHLPELLQHVRWGREQQSPRTQCRTGRATSPPFVARLGQSCLTRRLHRYRPLTQH
jgi:HD-like signal output (HDOD) protein